MADLNFNCPQCGQNLDAPEDMVGLFIECPACAKIIKIPRPGDPVPAKAAQTPFKAPPPETEEEKGKTIPIKLPPNLGVPPTPQRRIVIKRKGA